ncbi:type II toxin-antitoxin system VapB family antitoxin [Pedobacter rhodius]|uniref:DUF2281 domain-containing protein n=1 Tax=Pedobacter rhodius TaxID=3004098 RepID=A0ABT4L2Y0_9SPHI|nr:DUF2281 domain-containing protein [Pedobacter sp. SJ11]MCZ4225316.1 DUF2281 domain-containing protein [Pedobacter sp. SJ11]
MSQAHIFDKIKMLPPNYQQEVEDFIDFISEKSARNKAKQGNKRTLGLLKGKMKVSKDFDEPLTDFQNYMQ